MTKEQIEGNKLIAEFCGWTIEPGMEDHEDPYYNQPQKDGYIPAMVLASNLRYHSSWDWLMQVVGKIETDGSQETGHNEIHITENTCEIFRMSYVKPQFKNFDNKSKISAVWKTVVQYIQWYNTQKQNQ